MLFRSIFADFHRVGVTVLVATHDPQLLAGVATRTLTLDNGRIVADTAAVAAEVNV